jgi:hypothetical protein
MFKLRHNAQKAALAPASTQDMIKLWSPHYRTRKCVIGKNPGEASANDFQQMIFNK